MKGGRAQSTTQKASHARGVTADVASHSSPPSAASDSCFPGTLEVTSLKRRRANHPSERGALSFHAGARRPAVMPLEMRTSRHGSRGESRVPTMFFVHFPVCVGGKSRGPCGSGGLFLTSDWRNNARSQNHTSRHAVTMVRSLSKPLREMASGSSRYTGLMLPRETRWTFSLGFLSESRR